ncbi:small ribosomal subunit protein mS34 [Onthophagus taurus]|uniref:small ribosomal subunit protein mS34 n=1 Tax=Onthophagus taurus TaxID=166361 RepID=UPI0039BEC9F8
MPYKYFGKTTTFRGKTLWEILGNLKNLGIGRVIVRSAFEKYPEPSFIKIVKVETLPSPKEPSIDNVRKVKVLVEKTFRGVKSPNLATIESSSYKTDYRLLSKDEEAEYCKIEKKPEVQMKILPRTMALPPLLKEVIIREMKADGKIVKDEPMIEIVYNRHVIKNKKINTRIANEGEKPNVEINIGLGKPSCSRLYKGLEI